MTGLRDCAILGTDCAYALGQTSQQTFMGDWSDAMPVTPLQVTLSPPPCPPGSTAAGCSPLGLPMAGLTALRR